MTLTVTPSQSRSQARANAEAASRPCERHADPARELHRAAHRRMMREMLGGAAPALPPIVVADPDGRSSGSTADAVTTPSWLSGIGSAGRLPSELPGAGSSVDAPVHRPSAPMASLPRHTAMVSRSTLPGAMAVGETRLSNTFGRGAALAVHQRRRAQVRGGTAGVAAHRCDVARAVAESSSAPRAFAVAAPARLTQRAGSGDRVAVEAPSRERRALDSRLARMARRAQTVAESPGGLVLSTAALISTLGLAPLITL